jgi:hypothetical protein
MFSADSALERDRADDHRLAAFALAEFGPPDQRS